MSRLSILVAEDEDLPAPEMAGGALYGGLLALGTVLPQTLALVGIAYAPLAALGMQANPLWCVWSAIAGILVMLTLTRQQGVVYGVRPGAALLYGSTLAACVALAPTLKLGPLGAMVLTALCLMLSAAVVWLAVRTGATAFARYLPAPVGRGLSLGFGLSIVVTQLHAVSGWFAKPGGGWQLGSGGVTTAVLLGLLVYLGLLWRRGHPNKPYLLALLPVAAVCVAVLEAGTLLPGAWVSAPAIHGAKDLLPLWLPGAVHVEGLPAERWGVVWTAATVLAAQALFVAFTFMVDAAGSAANVEHLTGDAYDLNGELKASAAGLALLPWLGLVPASCNVAATRPLYEAGLRNGASIRLANLVVLLGLAALLGMAWVGFGKVPVLFIIAALMVIGINLLDPSLLRAPGREPGEREMWWQTWFIGLVFLFTGGVFAMLAGFLVAVAQFVRGAEGNIVRSIYTLREIRSRRWRGPEEEILLRRGAARAVVVVLQGTANFAVARRIREEISRIVQPQQVDVLLIDAQRVIHWDLTALDSFRRMADEFQRSHVDLLLSHPSDEARLALGETVMLFNDTDRAVEWAENEVLRRLGMADAMRSKPVRSVPELPLLASLSAEGRSDLAAHGKTLSVPPGQAVFDVGDNDSTLMVMMSGSVSVIATGRAEAVRVASFGPGMVLGEMAFLDGSARSARAQAITHCELFVLPRSGFAAWAQHHPRDAQRLLNALAAQISHRLRFTTAQLISVSP